MAKVFVSYASADRAKVAKLAGALEKRGHEVWWDHHLMPGEDYRDRIEQALAGADAVIVAWSAASIHSDWVQSEADDARKSGKLAPATLDGTLPPKPFDRLHTESLKGWSGGARDHRFAKLAESVEAIAEGRAARPVKYRRPLLTWGGVSAGAVAALALVANIGTVRDLFAPPPATVEDMETLRGEIEALRVAVAQQTAPENGEVDPQRAAEREAAIRDVVDEEPEAARLIAAGDLGAGLDALAESAEADARNAARKWREIGQLAYDREPTRALEAYRRATALDGSDFSSWIYLSRLERQHAGQLAPARAAAQRALEVAGDERARSVAVDEIGDVARAEGDLGAAKAAYGEGLELARALSAADPASAAARRDVSVSLNKLGNVAVAEGDLGAAKAAYAEDLEIARALSAADPSSAAARRDVIVSLDKMGNVTGETRHFEEALDIALEMQAAGQLSPADAFIPDYLRGKIGEGE